MVKIFFPTSKEPFPYYTLCALLFVIPAYLQEKSSSSSSIPFTQVLADSSKVVSCHLFWPWVESALSAFCWMPFAAALWPPHLVSISWHPSHSGKPNIGCSAPQSVSQIPSRRQGSSPACSAAELLPIQLRQTGDFLCSKGTLLVLMQTAFHQAPQIPFCITACQPSCPQPIILHKVIHPNGNTLQCFCGTL